MSLTVIWGRCSDRDDNKVVSLFIRCLAVADLLTGVYLLVLACKDVQYRGEYQLHAYQWMHSAFCTVLGVLALTAAEVSLLLLTVMSLQRWICITWPLHSQTPSLSCTKKVLIFVWAIGLFLAILPTLIYGYPFYGSNGLCFPLLLDDPWAPGWKYSTCLLLCGNLICVLIIIFCYACMFGSIKATRSSTTLGLDDKKFAARFIFIVLTDCICWTPILVFKALALAEIQITSFVYAYIVVLLLPINSCLNPLIYTFITPKFKLRMEVMFNKKFRPEKYKEMSARMVQNRTYNTNLDFSQESDGPRNTFTRTSLPLFQDSHKDFSRCLETKTCPASCQGGRGRICCRCSRPDFQDSVELQRMNCCKLRES